MGQAARTVRDRVVDVTVDRCYVTARGTAGQIPAAHKVGELLRGSITGLRRCSGRVIQRTQSRVTGQFGDQFGGDKLIGLHKVPGRLGTALDTRLIGNDVDYHVRRVRHPAAGSAVLGVALAGQPLQAGGQRA